MKDCMFQYATRNAVICDTDLITQGEALGLFNDKKAQFKSDLENGLEPEMAIWIDCSCNSSYGETLHHWVASDFRLIDGEMWGRVDG